MEFRMKVYGPYTRKDGRQHVIIYENGNLKTVSYPKYLVETKLNIKLKNNETVDHLDGDFLNNELSNLRVVDRAEHASDDSMKTVEEIIEVSCLLCGKKFKINTRNKDTTGSFCSRHCSGKYGQLVQVGKMEKIPLRVIKRRKHKPKNSKQIEPIIRNNNGGHGDIGEALTDNADGNTEGTGNRTP
jgi:hypothetical protein